MKQVVFVCAYACIFLGLSIIVSAQEIPATKSVKELKAVYAEFDQATKELNTQVFEKYLGENYLLEAGEEIIDKREMLANLRGHFALIQEISESVSTIEKIKIVEGSYVLDVVTVSVGKIKISDGSVKEFSVIAKSTDVWQKDRRGNWRQNTQIDRGNKIEIARKKLYLA